MPTVIYYSQVELWGKECPKAVRNFLALTMEGTLDWTYDIPFTDRKQDITTVWSFIVLFLGLSYNLETLPGRVWAARVSTGSLSKMRSMDGWSSTGKPSRYTRSLASDVWRLVEDYWEWQTMEVGIPILPNSLSHLMLHLNSQTNILCLERLSGIPSLVCLWYKP